MNAKIKALAESKSAIDAINQDLIRTGFELEFHALNGVSEEGNGSEIDYDSDPNYDALDSDAESNWDDLSGTEFVRLACSSLNDTDSRALVSAWENSDGMDLEDIDENDFSDEAQRDRISNALERAKERWISRERDRLLENNPEDYYPEIDCESGDPYEELEMNRAYRKLVDCGSDCSVRGGEIRTLGPLKPLLAMAIAKDLLISNTFSVDNGCSFHIHLSVIGVKHSYGKALQAEMTAYLLDNIKRMPKGVQERVASDKCTKYACPKLSTEKFTAVHYHSQGTWEFRIFGNVDNAKDARTCFLLAIEAMRHAYRVKLSLSPSLVNTDHVNSFDIAAAKAAKQETPLKISLKRERKKLHALNNVHTEQDDEYEGDDSIAA